MLTCTQAQTLIIRTIDDQSLSADARAILRQHLSVCANCRDEYETQHEVRRLLALQIEDRLPPGFTERLNARLARQKPKARRARRNQDAPTIGARDASQGAPRHRPAMIPAVMPASAASASSSGLTQAPASWSASASTSLPAPALGMESGSEPGTASALRSAPFAQTSWRRVPRWSAWAARLIPVAATVALIVADGRFHAPTPPPPESSSTASSSTADTPASAVSPMTRGDAPVRRRDQDRASTDGLRQSDRPTSAAGTLQASTTVLPKDAQVPAGAGAPHAALLGARVVTGIASPSTAATASVPLESAPIELRLHPPVLAPDVAEELKLSDAQRKQIAEIYDLRRHAFHEIIENTRKRVEIERSETDAAIERVLTREQWKQYRERFASQSSPILQTTPVPLPDPARPGMPPDLSVVPGPPPRSPISPTSPTVPPFDWR